MFSRIFNNLYLWDLSRYFLDLTCGLYKKRIKFIKDLELFKDTYSVLDIGCGTGLFAEITHGYYVGIDSNSRNIERANKKSYKEAKIFRCIDISVLEKEKAKFDITLIVDVLHHLDSRECINLLKDSAKITKKYLINFDIVLKKDQPFIEKWFIKHDQGKNFRSLDDFNRLFQASGYRIIKHCDMKLGYLSTHFTLCCLDKK